MKAVQHTKPKEEAVKTVDIFVAEQARKSCGLQSYSYLSLRYIHNNYLFIFRSFLNFIVGFLMPSTVFEPLSCGQLIFIRDMLYEMNRLLPKSIENIYMYICIYMFVCVYMYYIQLATYVCG